MNKRSFLSLMALIGFVKGKTTNTSSTILPSKSSAGYGYELHCSTEEQRALYQARQQRLKETLG